MLEELSSLESNPYQDGIEYDLGISLAVNAITPRADVIQFSKTALDNKGNGAHAMMLSIAYHELIHVRQFRLGVYRSEKEAYKAEVEYVKTRGLPVPKEYLDHIQNMADKP